jgi:hypothetical protein
MATYTKAKLSASTDGKPIAIAAITSPGTTIHAAGSGTTNYDEVTIVLSNRTSADERVVVEWGGTTNAEQRVVVVPGYSEVQLTPGPVLQNSAVIRAYAQTASAVNASGHVNTVAP